MKTVAKIFAIASLILALTPFGNEAVAFDPASSNYGRFQPSITTRNCVIFGRSFVVTGTRCNDGYDSAARQLGIKPGTVRVGWSVFDVTWSLGYPTQSYTKNGKGLLSTSGKTIFVYPNLYLMLDNGIVTKIVYGETKTLLDSIE